MKVVELYFHMVLCMLYKVIIWLILTQELTLVVRNFKVIELCQSKIGGNAARLYILLCHVMM